MINKTPLFLISKRATRKGAALVVVLVLLVLMLGIVLAFFSQSILQKQISKSSATQTAVDILADGAVTTVVGDLQSEIKDPARSSEFDISGVSPKVKLFYPTQFKFGVPDLVNPPITAQGTVGTGLENLVKVSTQKAPFYVGSTLNRASNDSTAIESANGRSISRERWNKPLLMRAADYSKPEPPKDFVTPDWIYVDRKGANPSAAYPWSPSFQDQNVIVGRYAYVVYNEGGLLDANVAGYPKAADAAIPSMSIKDPVSFKVGSSYANLKISDLKLTDGQVEDLINWRNNETLSGGAPKSYFDLATKNNKGFLTVSSSTSSGNLTDHMFGSRQQLINFFKDRLGANPESLQFFGTFSRVLDQPSYTRAQRTPNPGVNGTVYANSNVGAITSPEYRGEATWPDIKGNSGFGQEKTINPPLSTIRVTNATPGVKRFDGSNFVIGEPLIKKRFPLDRLVWVTYKGPSAENMSDPIIDEYIKDGISRDYLALGTRDNIEKCFGLNWHGATAGAPNGYWSYDVHGTSNPIDTLDNIHGREPDFFELLKAAINVGSIGKDREGIHANLNSGNPNYNGFNIKKSTYINNQIIQIGANMIDQVAPENFPTTIVFDDRSSPLSDEKSAKTFFGVVDLPYWYGEAVASVLVDPPLPPGGGTVATVTKQGEAAGLLVPVIWNPNQTPPSDYINGLTPTQLRIWVTTSSGYRPGRMSFNQPWYFDLKSAGNTFLYRMTPPNWSAINSGITSNGSLPGVLTAPGKGSNRTALYFNNSYTLYRQPTPLLMVKRLGDAVKLEADPGNDLVTAKSPLSSTQQQVYTGGYPTTGISEATPSSETYLGFFTGCFTVWRKNAMGTFDAVINLDGHPGDSGGLTYSLEYLSGDKWIPYSQISIGHTQFGGGPVLNDPGSTLASTWSAGANGIQRDAHFNFDPRTNRLNTNGGRQMGPIQTDGTIDSQRPGTAPFALSDGWSVSPGGTSKDMFISGAYFADADGIVRRPMGGFVPTITNTTASSVTGLPMATPSGATTKYNRPIMLRRPFRSVGEISYAFSDMPWRNLDCFSAESGFSGLLDVFCVGENSSSTPMIAGKVDLNTRQIPVLKSLLVDAYRDEWNGTSGYSGQGPITDGEANALATALVTRTTSSGAGKGPLFNISDLVGRFDAGASNISSNSSAKTYSGFAQDLAATGGASDPVNVIERLREAPMRVLASAGQAGTWNLLIDVIAQTGRFPARGGKFVVDGERRVWMHVAIDRLTGKVIDSQTEDVAE